MVTAKKPTPAAKKTLVVIEDIKPKKPQGRRPGNRSREQVMDDVCVHLEKGLSLWKACAAVADAPHPASILSWKDKYPDTLGQQYALARMIGYTLLAEEIVRISDEPNPGVVRTVKANGDIEEVTKDVVERSRLQVDSRKWMLSKMLPKIYGERIETVHSGSLEVSQPIDQVKIELALLLKHG